MKNLSIYVLVITYILLLINGSYADCSFWLCDKVSSDLKTTWNKDIVDSIIPVIEYLLWFIWIFALIFVMKWWFQMMISNHDEEKFKNGKKTLIFSLIWLFIVLVAYSIISMVFVSLWEIDKIK